MNKFLCSLACTWVTKIDSQFYIIDSLSLDVSLEWNVNLFFFVFFFFALLYIMHLVRVLYPLLFYSD